MKPLKLLSPLFIAGDVVNKGKAEFKKPNAQKYDLLLNNKRIDVNKSGQTSKSFFPKVDTFAENSYKMKSASEILDSAYIEKTSGNENNNDSFFEVEPAGDLEKKIFPYAVGATILGASVAHAIKEKNPLAPFRTMGDALKKFPKTYSRMMSQKSKLGRFATRVVNKAKKTKDKTGFPRGADNPFKQDFAGNSKSKNFVDGLSWGIAAGTGTLGVHMIGDRYFARKNNHRHRVVQKSYDNSIPDAANAIYNSKKRNNYNNRKKPSDFKKASEFLEYIEKEARLNKDQMKKVLHEDVLQNAVMAIPMTLAPLAVSKMIGRDIRRNFESMKGKNNVNDVKRTIIDIPSRKADLNKQEKTAAFNTKESWKKFLKSKLPSATLASISVAVPVSAISSLSGRDFRNKGEKFLKEEDRDVKPGMTRIIIEEKTPGSVDNIERKVGRPKSLSNLIKYKKAEEIINDLYKEASAAEADVAKIIDQSMIKNKKKREVTKNKSLISFDGMTENVKKKQQMLR